MHDHDHEHNHRRMGRRFILALAITSLVLVAEIAGGILSRSLALLSDAGHVFLDVFALAMSYVALRLSDLPADEEHTFGFHRAKVLAALANSLLLFLMVFFIAREAWERWLNPQPVNSGLMLGVAVVGLVANLLVARVLHDHDDLNTRSAFLHVLGDALASVGVIAGAIIIALTGWYVVDPILSVLISVLILGGAWRIFRESVHILAEGSPAGVSARDVAAEMGAVAGVQNIHDLHVWSVGPGYVSLSAHVVLGNQALAETQAAMDAIKERLEREFGIHHTTIQFECDNCGQCVDAFEGGVCYPRPVAPNGGGTTDEH
jgi:cobalt-zinc-cadmium efflux system protein